MLNQKFKLKFDSLVRTVSKHSNVGLFARELVIFVLTADGCSGDHRILQCARICKFESQVLSLSFHGVIYHHICSSSSKRPRLRLSILAAFAMVTESLITLECHRLRDFLMIGTDNLMRGMDMETYFCLCSVTVFDRNAFYPIKQANVCSPVRFTFTNHCVSYFI